MSLFFRCGPTAVIRAVALVIVNAVNTQAFLVSMGKCPISKSFKIMEPFGADGNTTTAVILVVDCGVIIASLFHTAPDVIQTGSVTTASSTMSNVYRCKSVVPFVNIKTSATTGISSAQISSNHNGYLSAVTATAPHCKTAYRTSGPFDNHQLSKPLAR